MGSKTYILIILIVSLLIIFGGILIVKLNSSGKINIPIINITKDPDCIYNQTETICSDDFTIKTCNFNGRFDEQKCFYGCNEGSCCQADYSDVAVVTNINSKVSKDISNYFMEKRNVTNQVFINVTESENINYATFNSSVVVPLKLYLRENQNIKYLVTTKGVPLRVTNTCATLYGSSLSFDNMVAGIFLAYGSKGECYGAYPYNYPYANGQNVVLVTRLDGYTYKDAIKLITPRVCNNLNGLILFDQKGTGAQGDPDMATAYKTLYAKYTDNAFMLESTTKFIINKNNIDGYISWGSNDGHVSANSSTWNLTFNPGSISDTWVSTGARSMTAGTTYGQSLIADLAHNGVSGISGYVNEPGLSAVENVQTLFLHYLNGKNLAQSFYLAMPNVDWQSLVLGDPKLYVVKGGKKDSCSGIPCSNVCQNNNILSYNGQCNGYGICEYKNMTCTNGCSNGICNSPKSCPSLGQVDCLPNSEVPQTYCSYQSFYNGFEYVYYNLLINMTTSTDRKPCGTSFFYCINGQAQCISSLDNLMTPNLIKNGNSYVFVGNWINASNLYDNDAKTYAAANITNGSAYVLINYTFTEKILAIGWNIYHDKSTSTTPYLLWPYQPLNSKTYGLNIVQLRIMVTKTTSGYKITYDQWNGSVWKNWCLDCLGGAVFNINTNKIYEEELASIYTGECYPNNKQCIAGVQYVCSAGFKWQNIGTC